MSFSEWKCTEFGKVNNEWSIGKLGEFITTLTDYHANGSYKKLKENVELFDEENYAIMIRTTNFEQNYFEKNGFKYITEHAYDFLEKSKVLPDDILMNKIANAGSVYLMPNLLKPVSLAMNLFLIRVDQNKINQRYVYYFLKNNEEYVKTRASGSVTKTITKDNVRNLEIAYPNINEQNFIVSTLSTLEQKIELNNCINKTLEEMAQAIFKSWFVDFEPFQEGEFEESELGRIPKGWKVGTLEECIDFYNGYAFKSKELLNSEVQDSYHVFKMGHIKKGGGLNPDGTKSWIQKNKCDDISKYVLKIGDLLMCMTDMKGNVALLGHTALMNESDKYIVNQRVGLLRTNNELGIDFPYLYILTNSNSFIENLRGRANSGVQVNLSTNEIKSSKLIIAPIEINTKFNELMIPMFHKMFEIVKENQKLTSIRDALLPKLMSGEIRVPIEEVQ